MNAPNGRSWISWLASLSGSQRRAAISSLSPEALRAARWLFRLWAAEHQLPPSAPWRTWLVLGGRGAGKTRAGSEWVRMMAEGRTPLARGACRRIGLVAATLEQGRSVMVEGESGILACSPPDRRPRFEKTAGRLVWENGAEARIFSAARPESLRGPQFDAAWADELAKWPRPEAAWDNLQLALRLGDAPRVVATTTPRRVPLLRRIMDDPRTAVTHAPTQANALHLAAGFLEAVEAAYGATETGRQELAGELLEDVPGALWRRAPIEAGRTTQAPALARVVVAVDPPATSGPQADECGIVVAGCEAGEDPKCWVLADLSLQGAAPAEWAARVAAAFHDFQADRVVAEVNQGGDMVETLIRQADRSIPYRGVRATRSKRVRAEPVSALYERGLVRHAGLFAKLEDQMCAFTGAQAGGSPDRVDALVWAITDLTRGAGGGAPQVRRL